MNRSSLSVSAHQTRPLGSKRTNTCGHASRVDKSPPGANKAVKKRDSRYEQDYQPGDSGNPAKLKALRKRLEKPPRLSREAIAVQTAFESIARANPTLENSPKTLVDSTPVSNAWSKTGTTIEPQGQATSTFKSNHHYARFETNSKASAFKVRKPKPSVALVNKTRNALGASPPSLTQQSNSEPRSARGPSPFTEFGQHMRLPKLRDIVSGSFAPLCVDPDQVSNALGPFPSIARKRAAHILCATNGAPGKFIFLTDLVAAMGVPHWKELCFENDGYWWTRDEAFLGVKAVYGDEVHLLNEEEIETWEQAGLPYYINQGLSEAIKGEHLSATKKSRMRFLLMPKRACLCYLFTLARIEKREKKTRLITNLAVELVMLYEDIVNLLNTTCDSQLHCSRATVVTNGAVHFLPRSLSRHLARQVVGAFVEGTFENSTHMHLELNFEQFEKSATPINRAHSLSSLPVRGDGVLRGKVSAGAQTHHLDSPIHENASSEENYELKVYARELIDALKKGF